MGLPDVEPRGDFAHRAGCCAGRNANGDSTAGRELFPGALRPLRARREAVSPGDGQPRPRRAVFAQYSHKKNRETNHNNLWQPATHSKRWTNSAWAKIPKRHPPWRKVRSQKRSMENIRARSL